MMRKGVLAVFIMAGLAGCAPAGGYVVDPSPWLGYNPWIPNPNTVPPQRPQHLSFVEVYKYQGSRQCMGGGVPLSEMQRQLQQAGVAVSRADCGTDGMYYAQFCGGADGRINIFSVDSRTAHIAYAQGFRPLSELPQAQKVSCYANPTPIQPNAGWQGGGATSQGGAATYPYSGTTGDTSYYTYRLRPTDKR